MKKIMAAWMNNHALGLFIYNLTLMLLVLLHTAGYFYPFFVITINFIAIFAFILSIFLLGARSRAMFLISVIFWIIAAIFKTALVDIWAERTSLYAFESFIVGVILLFWESLKRKVTSTSI